MRKLIYMIMVILLLTGTAVSEGQAAPFMQGEKITYDIKKLGFKVGEAVLEFKGPVTIAEGPSLLIIFTAEALNFYDQEKIYVNPQTFYPIKVERSLDLWGKKEQITEHYADDGKIKIVKNAGGQQTEEIIKKSGQVDNVYGFLYRYRRDGDFKIGNLFDMNLPTKDLKLRLSEMDRIKAAGEKQEAFFMESDPTEYKMWFGTSDRHLPLRIDGAVGIGNTKLIMSEYKAGG